MPLSCARRGELLQPRANRICPLPWSPREAGAHWTTEKATRKKRGGTGTK